MIDMSGERKTHYKCTNSVCVRYILWQEKLNKGNLGCVGIIAGLQVQIYHLSNYSLMSTCRNSLENREKNLINLKLSLTWFFLRHFLPNLTRYSQNLVKITFPLVIDPAHSSKLKKKLLNCPQSLLASILPHKIQYPSLVSLELQNK